jgi:hypothetical protein
MKIGEAKIIKNHDAVTIEPRLPADLPTLLS